MNDYLEKFLRQAIMNQIKLERQEEQLEFEFWLAGTQILMHNYNGKAYISCWNDEKGKYFDAIVGWKEIDNQVEFQISYDEYTSKQDLGIYHWM